VAELKKKPRNPDETKRRILAAAKVEFARKGLGGARVDDIAARAKANKRMMYHYFGNKDDLFRQVVEYAYGEFREREAALDLDSLEPVAAIKTLIAFIWKYFLDNPEFITLVNSENLHKARHIKKSERMQEMSRSFVGRMQHLLERGVKAKVFRKGLDPVQVNISIAAVGYYYLTNHHTGSIVFERDLMSQEALAARLDFNTRTILRMICTPETLEGIDA
jgi:AcrR family transcriptional regulator